MLQDAHTAKESIPVTAPVGDTTIIAAKTDAWIYVHELIGDLSLEGTLEVLAGARILASFTLDAGQGLTLQDEPGNDGVARFTCRPGEAFILRTTGGTFKGSCDYSLRY